MFSTASEIREERNEFKEEVFKAFNEVESTSFDPNSDMNIDVKSIITQGVFSAFAVANEEISSRVPGTGIYRRRDSTFTKYYNAHDPEIYHDKRHATVHWQSYCLIEHGVISSWSSTGASSLAGFFVGPTLVDGDGGMVAMAGVYDGILEVLGTKRFNKIFGSETNPLGKLAICKEFFSDFNYNGRNICGNCKITGNILKPMFDISFGNVIDIETLEYGDIIEVDVFSDTTYIMMFVGDSDSKYAMCYGKPEFIDLTKIHCRITKVAKFNEDKFKDFIKESESERWYDNDNVDLLETDPDHCDVLFLPPVKLETRHATFKNFIPETHADQESLNYAMKFAKTVVDNPTKFRLFVMKGTGADGDSEPDMFCKNYSKDSASGIGKAHLATSIAGYCKSKGLNVKMVDIRFYHGDNIDYFAYDNYDLAVLYGYDSNTVVGGYISNFIERAISNGTSIVITSNLQNIVYDKFIEKQYNPHDFYNMFQLKMRSTSKRSHREGKSVYQIDEFDIDNVFNRDPESVYNGFILECPNVPVETVATRLASHNKTVVDLNSIREYSINCLEVSDIIKNEHNPSVMLVSDLNSDFMNVVRVVEKILDKSKPYIVIVNSLESLAKTIKSRCKRGINEIDSSHVVDYFSHAFPELEPYL